MKSENRTQQKRKMMRKAGACFICFQKTPRYNAHPTLRARRFVASFLLGNMYAVRVGAGVGVPAAC
jgi:hypothetical protein